MRTRMKSFFLVLAFSVCGAPTCAQGSPVDGAVHHEKITGDLANALARVAWLCHVPVIAELAQPLPNIQIAEGTEDAKDLLKEVARQAPDYKWDATGKVIFFYNKKLREAKFNFLNLRFPRFSMPVNLSELKLTFPTREYGLLLQGYSGGGIVTTGFGDAMLEKDLLQPAILKNVTGREILLQAANESPTFFTVIVFPNAEPTKKQVERDMNRNWFWQALKDEHLKPLYVQPVETGRR